MYQEMGYHLELRKGLHASMIVKESTLRVLIKETKIDRPQGKAFEWEMKISDI